MAGAFLLPLARMVALSVRMRYVARMDEDKTGGTITSRQAAKILNTTASTVNRMIADGRLEGHKAFDGLRAPYLINRADVERLARERAA